MDRWRRGFWHPPPLMARYLVESQIGYVQIQIQFGIHAAGRPATPAQGRAGWAPTPRDPKSHLFDTNWVAVAPFGTLKPASGSEFRPGSRRGGPVAQIPIFLTHFGPQNAQKSIFWEGFEFIRDP